MRCGVDGMDGIENHAGVSIGHGDVPGIETKVLMPTNVPEIIRTSQKKMNSPNLPARGHPDESNALENHTDMSNIHTEVQSSGNKRKTAENKTGVVRTPRIRQKM